MAIVQSVGRITVTVDILVTAIVVGCFRCTFRSRHLQFATYISHVSYQRFFLSFLQRVFITCIDRHTINRTRTKKHQSQRISGDNWRRMGALREGSV